MGPDGITNQEVLRWRGPAAIYPTDLRVHPPWTATVATEKWEASAIDAWHPGLAAAGILHITSTPIRFKI
jgi:hypothetical protein